MAIYYVYSGAGGSNNGSSWANAFTTLTTAFATEVAGDTLYVAQDHAESTGAAITLTSSGTVSNWTKIVCVDRAGTVPPVSADRRTTAQVSTTTGSINFVGFAHYDGIIFRSGVGAAVASNIICLNAAQQSMRFDNCSLRVATTGTTSKVFVNNSVGSSVASYVELNNTTVSFAVASQGLTIGGILKWRNTSAAYLGTVVTGLFQPQPNQGGVVECVGVDLSAVSSTIVAAGGSPTATAQTYRFIDCKLHASATKSTVPGNHGSVEVDFIRSGASGVNYSVHRNRISGTLDEETTIVRTGGATDGTTPISWKIVTTANCNYSLPFECPPIAIWNDTTGSAKTATVEGIWGGGAVPNDDDVWLDVEYLGDASSPLGSFVNDGKADLLATAAAQASSSATWGGSTTKFKLNVTLTAQQKGWVYCRVKIGKASTTAYIDPLVTLT